MSLAPKPNGRPNGREVAMQEICVHELVPLSLAPAGQSVIVAQLMGNATDVQRLKELGLREGARLEMVQSGSPCIIRLSGHKLCFRDGEAFRVLVRLGEFA